MKLVIQRVKKARVRVRDRVVGEIGKGLFILLGVGNDDTAVQAESMAKKCADMRLMADSEDKMNLSVKEVNGEVLVVSQFTLLGDTSGGRRPSFVNAAEPELARQVYEKFVSALKDQGIKVATGSFGNFMEIETIADGPVTITLDH